MLFVLEYSEALLHTMEAIDYTIDYNVSDGFTLNKEEGYAGYSASVTHVLDMVQVCFHYISIKSSVIHILLLKIKLMTKKYKIHLYSSENAHFALFTSFLFLRVN